MIRSGLAWLPPLHIPFLAFPSFTILSRRFHGEVCCVNILLPVPIGAIVRMEPKADSTSAYVDIIRT